MFFVHLLYVSHVLLSDQAPLVFITRAASALLGLCLCCLILNKLTSLR